MGYYSRVDTLRDATIVFTVYCTIYSRKTCHDSPQKRQKDASGFRLCETLRPSGDIEQVREQSRRVRDDGAAGHADCGQTYIDTTEAQHAVR